MNKYTEVIHLPDLLFIQFCSNQFGINRGVYNTIDKWLYENGERNIIDRRKRIYHFLDYCLKNGLSNDGKIKFGHGNLSNKLTEYLESHNMYDLPISV
ncbi:MAG TPA: hypothetical protein VEY51_04920 [Chondromyces sp.]|nr:hypothetical protein [Chondromyces sp.]